MTDIKPYNDETKAWADLVMKTAKQKGIVKNAGTEEAERSLLSRQIAYACSIDHNLAYS